MANICRVHFDFYCSDPVAVREVYNQLHDEIIHHGEHGLNLGAESRPLYDPHINMPDGNAVVLTGEVRWGFKKKEVSTVFTDLFMRFSGLQSIELYELDAGFPYCGCTIGRRDESEISAVYAMKEYLCGGINAIAHAHDEGYISSDDWSEEEWRFCMQTLNDECYTVSDYFPLDPNNPEYKEEDYDRA